MYSPLVKYTAPLVPFSWVSMDCNRRNREWSAASDIPEPYAHIKGGNFIIHEDIDSNIFKVLKSLRPRVGQVVERRSWTLQDVGLNPACTHSTILFHPAHPFCHPFKLPSKPGHPHLHPEPMQIMYSPVSFLKRYEYKTLTGHLTWWMERSFASLWSRLRAPDA
ncbi:hypothetical protein VNO77_39397 [Canavalia gladiata]|uniref:Uncharacterized protein n=1 Tax=Canavalia gladiata TaxID=3824 RepID=A0AAN9KEA7_CANGL